jgi:hypothetical protein
MNLQPVAGESGAWFNPRWKPGSPGTFAMIIGVSRYDHLDGSERSLWLNQLQVSALTAYRVFEWLDSAYHVEGCPVARCWLVLSPTEDELRVEPGMAENPLLPTFENCEKGIGQWESAMESLPKTAAGGSRGLFFFSGHGFESTSGNQVLLPSDYLTPPNRNPQRALAVAHLAQALGASGVRVQLFFLDACRNAPNLPNPIVGRTVLRDRDNNTTTPNYVAPILYATNSGQQAFQHPTPERGISLFGRALLDGLAGQPNIALKEAAAFRLVNVMPLLEFMEGRVARQLEAEGSAHPQPVRLGGNARNELVAQLPLQLTGHPQPDLDYDFDVVASLASQREDAATGTLVASAVARLYMAWDRSFHGEFREPADWMSMEWLRLIRIGQQPLDSATALRLRGVDHDRSQQYWRVELSIDQSDRFDHCVELREASGRLWTAVLPHTRGSGVTSYQLELEFEPASGGHGRRLVGLRASFGAATNGPAALSREIWSIYTFAGFELTLTALRALARHQTRVHQAPQSAVLAGLIAFHLGDRPLAKHFSDAAGAPEARLNPDAEVLRRACGQQGIDAHVPGGIAMSLARELLDSGMPRFAQGIRTAGQLLPARGLAGMARQRSPFDTMSDALVRGSLFATFCDRTAEEVSDAMKAVKQVARVSSLAALELHTAAAAASADALPPPTPAAPTAALRPREKKKDEDEDETPVNQI